MIFTISIKFLKRKFDNKMTCIKKGKDKIQFDENKKFNFIVLKPLDSISFFWGRKLSTVVKSNFLPVWQELSVVLICD